MLKSYFKIAIRGFYHQKTYSLINIAGLFVGLACSFLILLWVSDELSINRFHNEGDRIYRVMRNYHATGVVHTWHSIPKPVADFFDEQIPDITNTVLVTWGRPAVFAKENGDTFRRYGNFVSSDFLEVFTFPLLIGSTETALDDPDAIAISDKLAEQYFGSDWRDQDILGRTMSIDHRKDFKVTGVFEYPTSQSSIRFDYLIPFEDFRVRNTWLEHWGNSSVRLFVKLAKGARHDEVNTAIRTTINDNHTTSNSFLWLLPYEDIYLNSQFENGVIVGGRIEYVRIFAIVALFILVIAGINYTNLATARSSLRAQEIGVRKAVGANKGALIRQFMGESILLTTFAAILAAILIQLLIPKFNALTDKELSFDFSSLEMLGAFCGISLLTGLIGGFYPAFYLSGFHPVRVLRGTHKHRPGTGRMRQGLVVFQFGWSILMIIGTLTVYNQLTYIQTKNLGLERENLVQLRLEGETREKFDTFRQELLTHPEFLHVTRSNQNPLSVGSSTSDPKWEGKAEDAVYEISIIKAGFDFAETMKLNIVQGRTFHPDRDITVSDNMSFMINRKMAAIMGTDEPVGKQLRFWGDTGTIVGLVQDFHISSLYNPIAPLIIRLEPTEAWRLYARIAAGKEKEAIEILTDLHGTFNPNFPMTHQFVTEDFDRMYRSEAVLGELATLFAGLAGFISCLGLFGLASFTAVQRTKEIGIRKTLGASVVHLTGLLSRDFVKLVALAFVIAVPVAYTYLNEWLNEFEYRVDLGWSVFAVAGILAVVIAWVTVSSQAIRVARANPTESLRSE